MSYIKICGVTRTEDVELIAEIGAQAVGINLWPGSPRFVEPGAALPLVEAARGRQRQRLEPLGLRCNAQLHGDQVRHAANPTEAALRVLEHTLAKLGLSARAWSRILKVARTVADLDGEARVEEAHVLEALVWRDHVRGQQ